MDEISAAFARLAGIRKGLQGLLTLTWGHGGRENLYRHFPPEDAKDYFVAFERPFQILREKLPSLYDDIPTISSEPDTKMGHPGAEMPSNYSRNQVERLIRAIDQVFEIRANSELAAPAPKLDPRVFISHGRSEDWRKVQSFIERDLHTPTLELAQEPSRGRTILAKLDEESRRCTFAVIVMTGDDMNATGTPVARQNVVHEIGFLQARLGLSAVCLLHEEGTEIPSNIAGLVYVPFPKGTVDAAFGVLMRELQAARK
jgi:predicted nucleotide-binding protein